MFVSPIIEKDVYNSQVFPSPMVRWDAFDMEKINEQSDDLIPCIELRGTFLGCATKTKAGQWENRKVFIERVITDISAHCPKEEPLVLISLGAAHLLMEYIIGKTLLEKGYHQISFLLVEPVYSYSKEDYKNYLNDVMIEFRAKMESDFLSICNAEFAKERIRFLSRSHNIPKYFPPQANVVVIESLPPYAEMIKDAEERGIHIKRPEEILSGGQVTTSTFANSVLFIPQQIQNSFDRKKCNLNETMQLPFLKNSNSEPFYYLEWGCKIKKDGSHLLSFSGAKDFFKAIGLTQKTQVILTTGENIKVKQWIPKIKNSIEALLFTEIPKILADRDVKKLTQEEMTSLLEKIKGIVSQLMPNMQFYFLADYVFDREEALKFIAENAGHHYRKKCSLVADARQDYKISIEEII